MSEHEGVSFHIGLALAGAISAGAYTAGVLDYLFQALDEWEKAKKDRSGAETPGHAASVDVIAGASAGAITGALGAVALARGILPQPFTQSQIASSYRQEGVNYQSLRCVLPSLYDTWVTRPRMVAKDGGVDFLSGEDLQASKDNLQPASVVSLLNSTLLDDIKEKALLAGGGELPETDPPYSYVAEPLHVYMTVSNLRGIPFQVEFGNSTYGMQTHGDRVHYAIAGLGTHKGRDNDWVDGDKHLGLAVATLARGASAAAPGEWNDYGNCALASSAFPIGFSSRQIETPMSQYRDRQYPMPVVEGVRINPNFPPQCMAAPNFVFRNVDGGLINNNPFDYAQYALMGGPTAPNKDGRVADSAVIMIAPFPEPPTFLAEGQPEPGLVNIIRALFPTLINQARFRASELAPALNSADYSRFLIAPHRKLPADDAKPDVEERYTIACGLLGGFGGFLDEGFRAHDFQLGRRNCQAFLRRTFAVPASNSLAHSMAGQPAFIIPASEKDRLPERYPIIPLLGSAAPEVALPYWPQMAKGDLELLLKRIRGRFRAVAPRLVRAQTTSRVLQFVGRVGLYLGERRLLEYVRLAILSDLIRRNQLEGWELPPQIKNWLDANWADDQKKADDMRAILAELASPAFNFRTIAGIAGKTHIDRSFVAQALARLREVNQGEPCSVWRTEWRTGKRQRDELFTLASRKPSWLRSLPAIGSLINWFDAPITDCDAIARQLGS